MPTPWTRQFAELIRASGRLLGAVGALHHCWSRTLTRTNRLQLDPGIHARTIALAQGLCVQIKVIAEIGINCDVLASRAGIRR